MAIHDAHQTSASPSHFKKNIFHRLQLFLDSVLCGQKKCLHSYNMQSLLKTWMEQKLFWNGTEVLLKREKKEEIEADHAKTCIPCAAAVPQVRYASMNLRIGGFLNAK